MQRDGGVKGKSGERLREPAEGGTEGGCAERKEEEEPGRAGEPRAAAGGEAAGPAREEPGPAARPRPASPRAARRDGAVAGVRRAGEEAAGA